MLPHTDFSATQKNAAGRVGHLRRLRIHDSEQEYRVKP
jgi:hypothetical protein